MSKKLCGFLKFAGIIFFCATIALSATSCIRIVGFQGSGIVDSQERSISSFKSVSVDSGMNLYITQTGAETIRIEAEDNILPLVITEVENEHLTIKYKSMIFGGITTRKPVNIYLTVKDLNEIKLSSGARLNSELITADNFKISLSSGSNGNISVDVGILEVMLSSGSQLNISGNAQQHEASLSSGVKYDAANLVSSKAGISASSGSIAEINVIDELDVNISSGASVEYYGDPQVTSSVSSGGVLKSRK